jgi:hypothetical protein
LRKSKLMSYEDYDQGVKASYKLGVLHGQADKQAQADAMAVDLGNMLKTNKELFSMITPGDTKIRIAPGDAGRMIKALYRNKELQGILQRCYDAAIKHEMSKRGRPLKNKDI